MVMYIKSWSLITNGRILHRRNCEANGVFPIEVIGSTYHVHAHLHFRHKRNKVHQIGKRSLLNKMTENVLTNSMTELPEESPDICWKQDKLHQIGQWIIPNRMTEIVLTNRMTELPEESSEKHRYQDTMRRWHSQTVTRVTIMMSSNILLE